MEGNRDFIRAGHNFKGGIDFFLSEKTTITISGQVGKSGDNRGGGGKTHEYTNPLSTEIFSVSEEISVRETDYYNGNLNFQHNFEKKGHKIEATFYYSESNQIEKQEESEFYSDAQYNKTNNYLDRVLTNGTEDESEFRFKADYT